MADCGNLMGIIYMKLGLEIDIDEINYAQLIRALLPFIKKEDIPLPSKVLEAAETPGVLENFLKFIPKDKQDELVLKIFDKNKIRIIAKAHKLADKAGIELEVSDIRLHEREDEVIIL